MDALDRVAYDNNFISVIENLLARTGTLERYTATGQDFRARRLALTYSGPLEVSGGEIDVTGSYHRVDTQAGAANDDLEDVNGTEEGQLLVLRSFDSGNHVRLMDGIGNLRLGANRTLDHVDDAIILISDGTLLYEVAFANNG